MYGYAVQRSLKRDTKICLAPPALRFSPQTRPRPRVLLLPFSPSTSAMHTSSPRSGPGAQMTAPSGVLPGLATTHLPSALSWMSSSAPYSQVSLPLQKNSQSTSSSGSPRAVPLMLAVSTMPLLNPISASLMLKSRFRTSSFLG